jgi:hypothetical protein
MFSRGDIYIRKNKKIIKLSKNNIFAYIESCFLLGHWDILKITAVTRMVKPFKMSQSFGTRWDIMGHFKYLIIKYSTCERTII